MGNPKRGVINPREKNEQPPGMSNTELFLAVDCGNTRLKATLFNEDVNKEPEVRTFDGIRGEGLLDWIASLKKTRVLRGAMSIVGKVDVRLTESLRKLLDGKFLVMTPSAELPIRMLYRTPLTLGSDRKATACGAIAKYPGEWCLVVDAGTALTIDLVSPEGEFVGGNISPGLKLRFRSLHEYTAALPLIQDSEGERPNFGLDTASAIRSGVVGGWLDEISGCACRMWKRGGRRILLTGGDGELGFRELPMTLAEIGLEGFKIEYCPHLLAEGLRVIYRHHEDKNEY